MTAGHTWMEELSHNYQSLYKQNKVILTFAQFVELLQQEPRKYIRNALDYVIDTLHSFGQHEVSHFGLEPQLRFNIFDLGTEKGIPIISGEHAQGEIVKILESFKKSSRSSKLILLHGPNGSAKSSTVETIAHGMQRYSRSDEGAIYRFNWIFPADRDTIPQSSGEASTIGFANSSASEAAANLKGSYALLEDNKIASKLTSEFKENPIFLIPMPQREQCLRQWIAAKEGISPADVELPPHILANGLSKKNFQIFENLLNAYGGDLLKVYRHIQVERFYFSKQYRVGLSTVEPQLSIDAQEKQLTLDRNISQLPAVLHTISFYQAQGELVEANRGMLEFSDLLKRPLESFKYLLNTIETCAINLSSGTANLDIVFIGTSNEKHLDSFKTIPDFSSFKGRIELVTVPYLLLPELESHIYEPDLKAIRKLKQVAPHTLEALCFWAVMTRLKQPDPEQYPKESRALIARLDPYSKVLLFEGKSLQPQFTLEEQNKLFELRAKLWQESQGMVVYEGRFGASPREIRSILHRASQNKSHLSLTPLAIFEELHKLTRDRSIYEFLQFEPRAQYHDANLFIEILKDKFFAAFEAELLASMAMADDHEYHSFLKRYVDHVVAEIKKERIWDASTNAYVPPSQSIMDEMEKILEIKKSKTEHRHSLLSRIAAYKLENPHKEININDIFYDYLDIIKQHYYLKQRDAIEKIYTAMLAFAKNETKTFEPLFIQKAEATFTAMQKRFGYDKHATDECLKALLQHKKKKGATTVSPLPSTP